VSLSPSVDRVPTATSASRARTSACNTRRIEAADPKPWQSRESRRRATNRLCDCMGASSMQCLSQAGAGLPALGLIFGGLVAPLPRD
jgi:hypothetical protein